ncbi:methyltransferase domain-containing protein [Actinoplanes sp. KI2]|uniref:methyltransferase domain-containing protein n=1 Tax=Actinoplanes sp. KI2 TaxID=2983315 RepID=UPI0021D5CBC6|nr:methyltransferase domain-containing protein [Actinoplanes sp. KI2]MCU7729700.1 methyltransferase domain-containing protein [Actinoplanes sp. KI2]
MTAVWEAVPVAMPRGGGLLWVDDLCHLGPDYLARYFRPQHQGIAPRVLALALRGAAPEVADHVLAHAAPELAAAVRAHGAVDTNRAEVLQAQLAVASVYFWEMAYHGYPEVYERFSARQQPPLDEMFPPETYRGRTVLDVGTGGGRLLVHLDGHAAELYGIDPCPPLLGIAGTKVPGAILREGGFDRLPLADASVDAVISHGAYQISEERGGLAGLAEIRRVLRPGGTARIAVAKAETARHLRSTGATEIPVRGAIEWTAPPKTEDPLLHHLLRLARVAFGEDGRATTPVWLFEVG